jgi:hypothetical protein
MDQVELQNIITGVVFGAMFIGYHIIYIWRNLHPEKGYKSMAAVNFDNRKIWAVCLMSTGDSLLAVQTIRNWSFSATMIAAASVSIVFGVLGLASNIFKINVSNPTDPTSFDLLGLTLSMQDWKLGLIFAVYLSSFFCFTQTIRCTFALE